MRTLLPSETLRFGVSADAHLLGGLRPASSVAYLERFVNAMIRWKPDFVIDLGDFACQWKEGQTTPQMHDRQLEGLRQGWAAYSTVPAAAYIVMGNHDVGWVAGGHEPLKPEDLYVPHQRRGGEDITKPEFLAVTSMPGRYYSFDVKGVHFIVLDGNNWPDASEPPPGHDGVEGAYAIDEVQKTWLAADLKANRDKLKVVFCHAELHHTPAEGSREGGDFPFPPVGKERSYVDNGWQLRDWLAQDRNVLAVFAGHKHENRWAVYGGVHYITLAALHWEGSFAQMTLSDRLHIQGAGRQASHELALP